MVIPDWLSIGADVSSFVGLAITVIVWIQTRAIKREILATARIPKVHNDLEHLADQLIECAKEWPKWEKEAIVILARLEAILLNILPKLTGSERKMVLRAQLLIHKRKAFWKGWGRQSAKTRNDVVWDIHCEVRGIIEALQQLTEDYGKRV